MAAFNPRNLSPLIKVFDELDWSKYVDMSAYGLDVGDILPYDARKASTLLERALPLITEVEENTGVTLLTIPKGLTFNKLVTLAGSPKMGNITRFRCLWDRISNEIGNIAVDKTYRIVITNHLFKKSRSLSITGQEALMSKIGCEMPKVLEATVLLVVTFMGSGKRPYSDSWTFVRCLEHLSGYQLIVGGFTPPGAVVTFSHFGFMANGVGGVLWKF